MILEQDHENDPMEGIGTARIKVIGVGGGGVNAVGRMANTAIPGVELLGVNTDVMSLQSIPNIETIVIGEEATKGLGTGGNPTIGRQAAEEAEERLRSYLQGADLVFIAAGLGGGTGTGAAPFVASLAREAGAVTVGVVTIPFDFEGSRRKSVATEGLDPLRDSIDTILAVSNERLVTMVNRNTPIKEAFAIADEVMVQAIQAVSRAINLPADINVDFADVKAVLSNGGTGLIGIGHGVGERRVLKAAKDALSNPMLDVSPDGAGAVLFVVNGGPDVTLSEMSEAGSYISGFSHPDAEIFFGMQLEEAKGEDAEVELIMIATRLPKQIVEEEKESEEIARLRKTIPIYEADAELPPFLRRGWTANEGPSPESFNDFRNWTNRLS